MEYLIIINLITFIIYGLDKWLAKKNLIRVSERFLISFAFIGGSVGALLGMQIFRHKTLKIKFYVWNIILLIIWIILILMKEGII